jgi:hypothetical protein
MHNSTTTQAPDTAVIEKSERGNTIPVRLIVSRGKDSEIMLVTSKSGWLLPEVEIPRYQRIPPNVRSRALERYGIKTICRFQPRRKEPGCIDTVPSLYQVADLEEQPARLPEALRWIQRHQIGQISFCNSEDRDALETALADTELYDCGALPGPFAKSGWVLDLISWLDSTTQKYRLGFANRWEQYNASPNFSLIRAETDGPAVWFKAVGAPNLHEYPITLFLADRYPQYMPFILATRDDWHGWLTLEEEGTHPDDIKRCDAFRATAHSLAQLQLETARDKDILLATGCSDLRLSRLQEFIAVYLDTIREFMKLQTNTHVCVLSSDDCLWLGEVLHEACVALQLLGIPDTLGHGDFNPNNIVVSTSRCVFLDWAEAHVGHPFFTIEYLLARFRDQSLTTQTELQSIRDAYAQLWLAHFSRETIDRSFRICRLLAVFAYAVQLLDHHKTPKAKNDDVAAMQRSLARRMYREAANLMKKDEQS